MTRTPLRTWASTCALALAGLALSAPALAQEPAAPAPTPPPAAVVVAPAGAAVTVKESAEGGVDHDLFIHHIAVGYFGVSQLPVGLGGGGAPLIVNAPVIGARYWATKMVGVDVGLGFGYNTNSVGGATGSTDTWGFALHGGLPLALADSKHFTFEVVPIEATVGFTGGSTPSGGAGPSTSLKGFRLDVGARVGAELHFGFIGIPQLALEGSIGLYLQHESFGTGSAPSDQTTTFSTTVGSDPWAIFTDSISALYYF